jgi:GNAT superfamily N-acetyltransferase
MRQSSIVIRSARLEDAKSVHELHTISVRTLCRNSYSPEVIDGWLADRSPERYLPAILAGQLFVAEQETELLGFGEAKPGHVAAVFVHPAASGRGVGVMLLHHAVELASAGHVGPIRLEATLNAVPFYEHFGFVEIERTMIQRNNVWVAAVIMEYAGK